MRTMHIDHLAAEWNDNRSVLLVGDGVCFTTQGSMFARR
jgi:hypothetical protein